MSDIAEFEYITRVHVDDIRSTLERQAEVVADGKDPVGDDCYTHITVDGATVEVTCSTSKHIVTVVMDDFDGDERALSDEVKKQVVQAVEGAVSWEKRMDKMVFEVEF